MVRLSGLCAVLVIYCCILSGCVAKNSSSTASQIKTGSPASFKKSSHAPQRRAGFIVLSELTDQFSQDLAADITARTIYLDKRQIRDVDTGDVANFSAYLQNELESSLSSDFLLKPFPEEAEIKLGVVFQRYQDQMRIFFKYHSDDYSLNKSIDYSINIDRLPKKSTKEKLSSKAHKLVSNIITDDLERTIYVKPLVNDACMCTSEFSRVFASLLSGELVRMHSQVQVIGDKPLQAKMSNTRAVRKKAKEVKELSTSDAFFVDADSVLEGSYSVNGDEVMITLNLKDLDGYVLSSANVDVNVSLIKVPLEDKTVTKLADLADRKTEDTKKVVKLSTSKSGDFPVYHNGEVITIYAQVKQPLYLYLYTIDSRGQVSLLYPDQGVRHQKTLPGGLIALPDEYADYELVAEPPFGIDAIKVFGSPVDIPLPLLAETVATRSYSSGVRAVGKKRKQVQTQLARQQSINPGDLVDYYRGVGKRFRVPIFEDSMVVETRQ